jgi:hypothetical protein
LGFFALVNSVGASQGLLGAGHLLRMTLFRRFMDRYFPAPPEPEEPTAPTAREHAKLAAGEYRMSRRPVGDFMQAQDLIARFAMNLRIVAHDDGTIGTPAIVNFERGTSQRWREVGNFTWREVDGNGWLDMEVEEGRVKAWVPRGVQSFVLEPVPWYQSARLNVILFVGSVAVIAVALLLWLVGALARRRSAKTTSVDLEPDRVQRFARLGLVAMTAFLLGWVALFSAGVASKEGLEPWIRLVQVIGLAAVGGGVAAIWSAWRTCRRPRSWWVKASSVTVALAFVVLIWFSFAFGLISRRLNY